MQLFKTNTPNTLTVQIPYAPVQSLPNLGPTSPQTPNHPEPPGGSGGGQSSPGIPPRGISYPPVSPKSSLRRNKALNTNKTPPLLKSRPVTSDGITIPVITGVPSNGHDYEDDIQSLEEKAIEDQSVANSATSIQHLPVSENEKQQQTNRKGRIDRGADARRYHTAGAIEDIKVCFLGLEKRAEPADTESNLNKSTVV